MARKEVFSDEPIDISQLDFGNTPLDYLSELTSPQPVKIIKKSKKAIKKAAVNEKEEKLDYFTKDGKISVQFLAKEGAAFLETASSLVGKMIKNFKKEVSKNDDEVGGKRAN